MTPEEIKIIINQLLAKMTPEKLAVELGVSIAVIYNWRAGRNKPSKADETYLNNLLKEMETKENG